MNRMIFDGEKTDRPLSTLGTELERTQSKRIGFDGRLSTGN